MSHGHPAGHKSENSPRAVADAPQVALDEAGRIAEDRSCRRCGYNLRGLNPAAACPECTTAIGRSIHGDLLRFCDPAWVDRLAKGSRWIIGGFLASLALSLARIGIGFASAGGNQPVPLLVAGLILASAAAGLMIVIGIWWLTTPDPGEIQAEPSLAARALARWCVMPQIIVWPLRMIWYSGGLLPPLLVVLKTVATVVGVVVLVGQVAGLVYLRRLALRIPRAPLARQTRIVMWAYGSANAVLVVYYTGGFYRIGPFMPIVGIVILLSVVVVALWALVLLLIYQVAFRHAAAEARTTWALKEVDARA